MTIKETADKWSKELIDDLNENYLKLGLKASGNWGRELEDRNIVSESRIRIEILGAPYTGALIDGRSPNRNQSDDSIRAFVGWAGSTWLKDWVEQKGINASPYAIAYKIAREGVKVPNANNPGTLISDVLTEDRIENLLNGVGQVVAVKLTSDIKKLF
jgi:hypothetical protein